MIDVENLRATADEMLSGLHAGESMRNRIELQSSSLSNLPSVANEMLGGLKADSALRHRILLSAQRQARAQEAAERSAVIHTPPRRFAPVAALAMAFVLVFTLGIFYGDSAFTRSTPLLNDGIQMYASEASESGEVSRYRSLFAGEDANPPLVLVNGRYYRMLESPAVVPSTLLDSAFTQVQTSLEDFGEAGALGVFSNVATSGARIYSISGLSTKTAVVAEVNGDLRLFQRVGYNGSTLVGEAESFEDTLDVMDQVAALELSGVGVVSDASAANELIYMLTEGDFTAWHSGDVGEITDGLTIYLNNGLSLQLGISDHILTACGAWSCPEFYSAYEAAM